MSRLNARLAVLMLGMIHCVVVNGAAESSEIECQGSVKPGSAVFVIENLEGNDGWLWYKTTSEDGLLEYQWSVTLGHLSTDGEFKNSGKSFGFSLFQMERHA